MAITPGPFDPLTQQGELRVTDATVHCRTRAQAEAVAHRLEQQIDWPDDCDWPQQEPMAQDLKYWSGHLESVLGSWNATVLAYKQAGGTNQDLINDYCERMLTELRLIPTKQRRDNPSA